MAVMSCADCDEMSNSRVCPYCGSTNMVYDSTDCDHGDENESKDDSED